MTEDRQSSTAGRYDDVEPLDGESMFAAMVRRELTKARIKHQPINSLHEGYAVILEEVDELWEEVRAQSPERDRDHILKELVQIAAMAQRTAEDAI